MVSSGTADLQVTVHVALFPLEVLAVIIAVPAFTAVTLPLLLTLAILALLDVQVTDWLALEGYTVAVRYLLCPSVSVTDDGDTDTLVGFGSDTTTRSIA